MTGGLTPQLAVARRKLNLSSADRQTLSGFAQDLDQPQSLRFCVQTFVHLRFLNSFCQVPITTRWSRLNVLRPFLPRLAYLDSQPLLALFSPTAIPPSSLTV